MQQPDLNESICILQKRSTQATLSSTMQVGISNIASAYLASILSEVSLYVLSTMSMGVESGGTGDTPPNQNVRRDVPSQNTHENLK